MPICLVRTSAKLVSIAFSQVQKSVRMPTKQIPLSFLPVDSIQSGNYGLCRILCQIYDVAPEKVTPHATMLISLLPKCELPEKLALLQLFASIAQKKPAAISTFMPQVDELLDDPATAQATLEVLLKIAEQTPEVVLEHFAAISNVVKANPALVAIAAQILSTAGRVNKVCLFEDLGLLVSISRVIIAKYKCNR